VLIASVTNATGYLVGSNQVIYPGAFGPLGDLITKYRRSGFESDLVIRHCPVPPQNFGLNPDTTTIQMVTEFFDTSDPEQIPAGGDDWYGLVDSTLKFGKLTMGRGKAFVTPATNSVTSSVRVFKRWVHARSRKFLVEEIPLAYVAEDLNALPQQASVEKPRGKMLKFASNDPHFPASPAIGSDTNQILLASADFKPAPGMILDYNEIDDGQDGYTFQNGQTYLVCGDDFAINGPVVFEGGTVIKIEAVGYDGGTYPCVDVYGTAVFPPSADNPAIFTSENDDSVGEPIEGLSTGNPSFTDSMFSFMAEEDMTVSNVCFNYAVDPVLPYGNMDLWNCEFAYVDSAIVTASNIGLHNVLIRHGTTNGEDGAPSGDQAISCGALTAENVTLDDFPSGLVSGESACLTNCLITASGGSIAWWTTSLATNQVVCLPDATNGIYQTAANANYYLAPGSPYRNVGITNISPDLLAELRTMTTYAPQDGGFPDTNADHVDLGYHYSVNEDSTATGVPDAWIWYWFGNYDENGTNLDSQGVNTLSSDYQNGVDPNVIAFYITVTNNYVNTTTPTVQLNIIGGQPVYYAAFAGSTGSTNWVAFDSTNITVSLGSADGVYDIHVGLKGYAPNATESWADFTLYLDRTPPIISITNPVASGSVVIKPYLQLKGFANEPLSAISCDVSNALGVATNLYGYVSDQFFDTTQIDYTTNYFTCSDVPLTNGINEIVVHCLDRAGNLSSTNISVVLDYTSATNPPSLSLIWPQEGMCVRGTNCTIRGTMSDETGSIVAQVVNGDGTTNVINGLIERNNMFWIEGAPINGTNAITVQATDAAGNITTTNITLYPATTTLTIDSTPTGTDLYQSTGPVSGTVGDPSATVTVNGIAATVDPEGNDAGTYDWNASNVPIYGQGTMTFDVSAVSNPSGGSDATSTTNNASSAVEAPATVIISEYYDHQIYQETNDGALFTVWDWTKNASTTYDTDSPSPLSIVNQCTVNDNELYEGWLESHSVFDCIAGTWTWYNSIGDGEEDVPIPGSYNLMSGIITSVPDADYLSTTGTGVTDGSDNNYMTETFARNVQETYTNWGGSVPYANLTMTAHTKMKLLTGGKSGINKKSLFCLMPSGAQYFTPQQPTWVLTPSVGIPNTSLKVGSFGSPGADGNLWKAIDDNSDPDVTVTAPCDHYYSNVTPQKYREYITASTSTVYANLDLETPEVCVGQLLQLSPTWSPGVPPFQSIDNTWWHLPDKYVNEPYQYSSVCTSYQQDADLLTNLVQQCWYVNGPGGACSTRETYIFPNGQSVNIAATGSFTVYRPSAKNEVTHPGDVSLDGTIYLQDAPVDFDAHVQSQFPGQANWTQLVNRNCQEAFYLQAGTFGNYWLDTSLFYNDPSLSVGPGLDNPVPLDDAPEVPIDVHVSNIDGFKTYLMFQPAGDGNIWVTLGRTDWGWYGDAYPGLLQDGGITAPQFNDTDEFPVWPNIYVSSGQ
jgi:hypothetical protein